MINYDFQRVIAGPICDCHTVHDSTVYIIDRDCYDIKNVQKSANLQKELIIDERSVSPPYSCQWKVKINNDERSESLLFVPLEI